MSALCIALLGGCQVWLDGGLVIHFPTSKVQALLAYLAIETTIPHSRDLLMGLLWPHCSPEGARLNLRQTLHRLRQVIPPGYLLTDHQVVQLNRAAEYTVDVASFVSLIGACESHCPANRTLCPACAERLRQAVALYRGDFLTHFYLDDCPAYEEWMVFKREWLHRQALRALHQLAYYHELHGQFEVAHRYAWRQVELDPLCEEGHQQLMRALALSGRRSEALAQYATCRRLLAHELNLDPSEETRTLYEQIRREDFASTLQLRPAAGAYHGC